MERNGECNVKMRRINKKRRVYYDLVSRKFPGSFIVKSISTHGRNNVPEHLQTL
jgi:hypothetical protein